MMSKQRNIGGGPARASARWFRPLENQEFPRLSPEELARRARSPGQPEYVAKSQQAKRIWRSLNSVLRGVSRPTEAEIEADEYDGSVSISQWLARRARKRDSGHGDRSVEMAPLTFCVTGCFSANLASGEGE
jgi:hypothetical protein